MSKDLTLVCFCFITGPCEQERLKVQYTAHQTFSTADSLTVGLTPHWDFSAYCWEMKGMPSICCLHDLDTFPDFFFSPEVLGHQQIVGCQILPFWLIFRHIYLQSLSFLKKDLTLYPKVQKDIPRGLVVHTFNFTAQLFFRTFPPLRGNAIIFHFISLV